jgi:hypothetical protein
MPSKSMKKFLLVSAALAALIFLARRAARRGQLPAYDLWQAKLAERHGSWYARELIARTQARFSGLFAARKQYHNPALRRHYEGNLLPVIALYQTLLAEGWSLPTIQEQISELFSVQLRPASFAVRALSRLPNPFGAFRVLLRLRMKTGYPEEGWHTRWEEDSPQRQAFTFSRCFYLDVLSEYGLPELTPMFCETDDRLAESFPPQIRWRRKGTLGKGAEACDFCYERSLSGE